MKRSEMIFFGGLLLCVTGQTYAGGSDGKKDEPSEPGALTQFVMRTFYEDPSSASDAVRTDKINRSIWWAYCGSTAILVGGLALGITSSEFVFDSYGLFGLAWLGVLGGTYGFMEASGWQHYNSLVRDLRGGRKRIKSLKEEFDWYAARALPFPWKDRKKKEFLQELAELDFRAPYTASINSADSGETVVSLEGYWEDPESTLEHRRSQTAGDELQGSLAE